MQKIITIVWVFAYLFVSQIQTVHADPVPQSYVDSLTPKEFVLYIAPMYKQDSKMLTELIFCESSFNEKAIHDGGRGVGIVGFHKQTFNSFSKKFGVKLDYNSSHDQIELMSIAFQKGEEYRDDWTSYNKYKKYGTCIPSKIRQLQSKKV